MNHTEWHCDVVKAALAEVGHGPADVMLVDHPNGRRVSVRSWGTHLDVWRAYRLIDTTHILSCFACWVDYLEHRDESRCDGCVEKGLHTLDCGRERDV